MSGGIIDARICHALMEPFHLHGKGTAKDHQIWMTANEVMYVSWVIALWSICPCIGMKLALQCSLRQSNVSWRL